MPDHPTWLVDEPYTDIDLGLLRSGKEAQISLIERAGDDGRRCLIARKRYLPRQVGHKGELEALGLQRASTFRHDVTYREGRQFRKSRDRRAVEQGSTYGKRLLQDRWLNHEHDVTRALWAAGVPVPFPIGFVDDCFDLQFVGDHRGAAPQLARARLHADEVLDAWVQLRQGLATMTAAGWVHGDLSAFNLLWWDCRLWFIDLPQAVDLAANPQGLHLLHRDVTNICRWFTGRGLDADPEALFAELLSAV